MAYIGSNSTLAAGETYSSQIKRVDWYDHIRGTANASQDGVLWIEQSWDPRVEEDPSNAIWDHSHAVDILASSSATSTPNSTADNQGYIFDILVLAPYWRLRFKATSDSGATDIRVNARLTTEGDF